jgi:hypothetical protein
MRLREAAGGCDKLLGLVAVDRRDQRVAGGEMAVESPGPDPSGACDLIEAGGRSLFCKSGFEVSSKRTRLRSASALGLRTAAGSNS